MELNLLRHHVPVQGGCALCGLSFATTSHCLSFCSQISKFWKDTMFWPHLKKCLLGTFLDFSIQLRDALPRYGFELFTMLIWAIWKEICRRKHDQSISRNPIKFDYYLF